MSIHTYRYLTAAGLKLKEHSEMMSACYFNYSSVCSSHLCLASGVFVGMDMKVTDTPVLPSTPARRAAEEAVTQM